MLKTQRENTVPQIEFALFSERNPGNVVSPSGLAPRQRHRIPHAQLTFSLNYIA